MATGNPALTQDSFSGLEIVVNRTDVMTIQGAINKTAILLLCLLLSAGWTWNLYSKTGSVGTVETLMMVGVFGGLAAALVTVFKKSWAPITAPIYAVLEGLFIGGISAALESSYPGIAIQAASLTFGTLFALLLAYSTGFVRATEKFKLGVMAATGGIAIVYFVSMILGFFGVSVPFIHGSGNLSILFSVFVVVIAALNLVIDFDFIEQASKRNVPKYMEWYSGFALMVTLVWLYIEILRLLSKMKERR